MLTLAKGSIPLQRRLSRYVNVFRIDKQAKKVDLPVTLDDHVKVFEEVIAFLSNHEQEELERTVKRNTNGPDLTILRATWQSFVIALESLTSLANTMTENGLDHFLDKICFEILTTLSVECFFKGMRADRDMPTVTNFAHRSQSSLRRGRHAAYLPTTSQLSPMERKVKKKDGRREAVVREFVREYRKGVRQRNVRSNT